MGRQINNLFQVVWAFFTRLFRTYNFESDSVILGHGRHTLTFQTSVPANNVWFAVTEDSRLPVCGGGSTVVGASVVLGGFRMFADVRTEVAEIEWFATSYVGESSEV